MVRCTSCVWLVHCGTVQREAAGTDMVCGTQRKEDRTGGCTLRGRIVGAQNLIQNILKGMLFNIRRMFALAWLGDVGLPLCLKP